MSAGPIDHESDLELPASGIPRAILDAAVTLFGRLGYHGTTVNEIIKAAGISKGGFYHHFPSKEDVLVQIHDVFISFELRHAEKAVAGPGSASEKLKRVIHAHVESITRFQSHITVFLQEFKYLPAEHFQKVKAQRDDYDEILQRMILQCIQEGVFRNDVDPKLATLLLLGMMNAAVQWYRPGPWGHDDIARSMINVFFEGMSGGAQEQ